MSNEESKSDVVKEARDLLSKTTQGPLELTRYEHGGGRLWRTEPRDLVADFYAAGDREFYCRAREIVSSLCDEVEQLKSLNQTQAESIVEFQREQKELRRALVEVLIPHEALLADAGSRKWIAPEVWGSVEQAVKAARSVVTPKGSEQ